MQAEIGQILHTHTHTTAAKLVVRILDLTNRKTIMKDAMNTLLCGRPGTGGEWQTGAAGDTVGYQTLSET